MFVDLHTTDGSFHGYALTYSPSLHPAAGIVGGTFGGAFVRDSMLRLGAQPGLDRQRRSAVEAANAGVGERALGAVGQA